MNVCPTVIPPAVAICTTGRGQIEEVITDDTGNEMYKVLWVEGTQAGQSSTIGGDNLLAAQLVSGDRVSKVVGIPCDPLVLQTNPGACPIGSFPLQGTYQGMMSATVPYTYQILWDDGTTTQPLPSGFQMVNDAITTPIIPPVPVVPVVVPPTPVPVPVLLPGTCKEKEYSIAGNCVDKTMVLIALAVGAYLYVNREKNGK